MSTPILSVTLFGNPSMRIGEEPVTGLPSSKVVALAYYLFATGRTHSRDTLAGLLWPDYDNSQAKKNLRGALYHLRNALDVYVTVSRQEAGPANADVQVDSRQFEALLQQANNRPANSPEQIATLRQALELYPGPFFEGFHIDDAEPFDEWLRSERERFGQMATQILNTLIIHSMETGDYLHGIHDATQLLTIDPLREESHRHLMVMLAMDGQQSAALAQYKRCANLLQTELDIGPDSETEALAARIREGELSPTFQIDIPPQKRHNLPAELTPFLGREGEVQQIIRALAEPSGRLIALVGVGGMGKTRLAIRTGHQLLDMLAAADAGDDMFAWAETATKSVQDGIYFVRLASIKADSESDSRIIAAIADAFQIELMGDGAMMTQLIGPLQSKNLLLILDNFEQLQTRAGLLVELLEAAAGLRIIVTSRTRLNLRGEQVIMLDGLPAPEDADVHALVSHPATALFVATAMAVSSGFVPDATAAPAIVRTCRLLQGLPLGIELAASWTRLLSCVEIAQELQQNLDFLTNARPDLPARHRSLRAAFDHSWKLLSTTEQNVLRRLAIFRGSFSRQAAASVAKALLPELVALMDNSMVKRHEVELDSGQTQARYELPEVLRQYASEQLTTTADFDSTAQAHADYYADYVTAIEPEFHGGDQIVALEKVTLELENLRAAWEWACANTTAPEAQQATAALNYLSHSQQSFFDFHDIRGWFEEGERVFRQAIDAVSQITLLAGNGVTVLLARLQARQAWFLFHLGKHAASEQLLLTSLTRLQAADERREMAFNLSYLGAVKRHTGDFNVARIHLHQALEIAETEGDHYGVSVALNTLGQVAWLQGDLDATVDYCQRALTLKRTIGDRRGMIYSLTYLGRAAEMRANYDEARGYLVESMRIAEALDDPRGIAQAQQNLANVAYAQGDLTVAHRLYASCLELYRYTGSRIESSVALTRLGEVAIDRGNYARAADHLHLALETGISIRSRPALLTSLLGVAQLRVAEEQLNDAATILALIAQFDDLDERQRNRYQQLTALVGADADGIEPPAPDLDALIAYAHKFSTPLSTTPSPLT